MSRAMLIGCLVIFFVIFTITVSVFFTNKRGFRKSSISRAHHRGWAGGEEITRFGVELGFVGVMTGENALLVQTVAFKKENSTVTNVAISRCHLPSRIQCFCF